ncbi:hypothetical protein [Roseicyclus sp.]|uniref:hypothetical protein n=1 Tax=Roseicyclus sp. TaxID=1914329 RepID=UPI001BCD0CD7|nr:hypothetical protein [Roseicyclus sp.]
MLRRAGWPLHCAKDAANRSCDGKRSNGNLDQAQIYQAFSSLRLSLETLTGAKENTKIAQPLASGAPDRISRAALSSDPVTRPQGVPDHRCEICPICATGDDLAAACWPRQTVHRHHQITQLRLALASDSLKSLVQSLNGLPGLKAWLLQTRQGLALVLKAFRHGACLQLASVATILRVLQAALPPQGQPLVVSVDEIPATDGVAVEPRIVLTPQNHAYLHPKRRLPLCS